MDRWADTERQVVLPDGTKVPAVGQGTWFLGESRSRFEAEKGALTAGITAGMPLIDAAEMYGEGAAEKLWSVPGCCWHRR